VIPVPDRIAGAVLGAAIGDAIGHPTEFLTSFDAIRRQFPPDGVTGFHLYWEGDGQRFAPYTDDTQMAELALRALIEAIGQDWDLHTAMQSMARRFVDWSISPQGGHRAPGNACLAGCRQLSVGIYWSQAGGATAGGCGSVMRAYPFGLAFVDHPAKAIAWATEHSKMTHRDPIALAACAGMAAGMISAMHGEAVPDIIGAIVDAAAREDTGTAEMIATAAEDALTGVPVEVALQRLQGWAAHEAIAAAAYVISRHPDDIVAGILEAANTPGDSDSIATLVGALLGARLGVGALPTDWLSEVERSAELLVLAGELSSLVVTA
jgi:ADP-ribosylglycohydrolase